MTEAGALELPGLWNLTPWGALVGLMVLFMVSLQRGWIIPKSSHEREVGLVKDSRDEWRSAAKAQEEVNQEIRGQNTDLIKSTGAATHFFETFSQPGMIEYITSRKGDVK